jgi:Peptidase S24-like
MRMLSGEKLGAAITKAMELKGVGPKEVAEHFGIKPPSVKDWERRGCVHKKHLGRLVSYFSDVVEPGHWGVNQAEMLAISDHMFVVSEKMQPWGHLPQHPPRMGDVANLVTGQQNAFPMAPVVAWASLGVDLYRANDEWPMSERMAVPTTQAISGKTKWVPVVDDALGPKIMPGDLVAIDPEAAPRRDKIALFKAQDGEFILRRFRPIASGGFEAYDGHGNTLDSVRHGLTVAGAFVGLFRGDA